jgi:hypothetical protein
VWMRGAFVEDRGGGRTRAERGWSNGQGNGLVELDVSWIQ